MITQKKTQPNPHLKKKKFDGKVVRLKKLNLVGTAIPDRGNGHYGKTSQHLENIVTDHGYPVEKQSTVDLPEIGVEIKGRDRKSTAPHSIASMSVETIIKTPYDQSSVSAKMQQQFRVYFDHTLNLINNQEMCDFSIPEIQERLQAAYEAGRRDLAAGNRDYAIKNLPWGYFERHMTETTYKFRIPHAAMKFFITLAGTRKAVSTFFDKE